MCRKEDLWAAVAEDKAKPPLEMEMRGAGAQGGRVRAEILVYLTASDH